MAYEEQDFIDGWQTYSNWIDDLREASAVISKYDRDQTFKQKLMSCKTNLERFELIWNNDDIKRELEKHYQKDLIDCEKERQGRINKSSNESTKMRQWGNESFKNSKYDEALNQYTQAIKYAPYPSQENQDKSLAFALANRSAVLYAMTRYRLCLLDIDLAIKYGYPEENKWKLSIRKVKCLHILSVWANDVELIKEDLMKRLKNRDTDKLIKTEIQGMFEFIENVNPEDMEKDETDVIDETVTKISNVSKTVSSAADCVEMSYDQDKGRYLMINKDVTFGRLLITELPFVSNLAPQKLENYCYNCFGCLHSCGLGCRKCSQVLYCSEECLNTREDVHSSECNRFLDFQEKLGVSYLVAHIMFKVDFDLSSTYTHTRKTADKKPLQAVLEMSPLEWPELVYKNSYASVLSLMDHASDYDYDEMMGYSLTAAYLMVAFLDQLSDKNLEYLSTSKQSFTGSIVLRHLLQLQTNLISILEQNLQSLTSVGHTISEMRENPLGVAIYPTVCLLNHSCSPNVLSIFHRNKFVARASRILECGSELNYCYGPSVTRMSKKDRQRRLKEQYFFDCSCDSCTNNRENENRALVCPECKGPVIYNQDLTNQCMNCKKSDILDAALYLSKLESFRETIEDDSPPTSSDGIKAEIRRLKLLELDLGQYAYWRHPLFVKIKSKLIDMASALDDLDLTLRFCEDELQLCDKTYGENSYESIMTKLKLINTKWQKIYYTIEESDTSDGKLEAIKELKTLQSTVNSVSVKLKELLASTNIIGAESSYESELKFLSEIYGSIKRYLISQEVELAATAAATSASATQPTEDAQVDETPKIE